MSLVADLQTRVAEARALLEAQEPGLDWRFGSTFTACVSFHANVDSTTRARAEVTLPLGTITVTLHARW